MKKQAAKSTSQEKKKKVVEEKKSQVKKEQKAKAEKPESKVEDNTTVEVEVEDSKAEDTSGKKEHDKKKKDLEAKVEEAEKKSAEWHDKYLRLSAEFDNYRKRTLKEKADLLKSAGEEVLKDILPVVDDFERGIVNIDQSQDVDALKQGVHLIYNKFNDFLKQKGIKEIEAMEKDFDLDFHEAMTKIPAPDDKLKGKVVDIIEKGYLLNDKVIRYAKVVVGE